MTSTTHQAAKSSKKTASYVSKSKFGSECCRVCTMFVPPDGCTAVEGEIAPAGWCKFFKRKPRK